MTAARNATDRIVRKQENAGCYYLTVTVSMYIQGPVVAMVHTKVRFFSVYRTYFSEFLNETTTIKAHRRELHFDQ